MVLQASGPDAAALLTANLPAVGADGTSPADSLAQWRMVAARLGLTAEQRALLSDWRRRFLQRLDDCYGRRLLHKAQLAQLPANGGTQPQCVEALLLQVAGGAGGSAAALSRRAASAAAKQRSRDPRPWRRSLCSAPRRRGRWPSRLLPGLLRTAAQHKGHLPLLMTRLLLVAHPYAHPSTHLPTNPACAGRGERRLLRLRAGVRTAGRGGRSAGRQRAGGARRRLHPHVRAAGPHSHKGAAGPWAPSMPAVCTPATPVAQPPPPPPRRRPPPPSRHQHPLLWCLPCRRSRLRASCWLATPSAGTASALRMRWAAWPLLTPPRAGPLPLAVAGARPASRSLSSCLQTFCPLRSVAAAPRPRAPRRGAACISSVGVPCPECPRALLPPPARPHVSHPPSLSQAALRYRPSSARHTDCLQRVSLLARPPSRHPPCLRRLPAAAQGCLASFASPGHRSVLHCQPLLRDSLIYYSIVFPSLRSLPAACPSLHASHTEPRCPFSTLCMHLPHAAQPLRLFHTPSAPSVFSTCARPCAAQP